MKEKFKEYLKNGLSDYDKEYLYTYKYVMLLSKNDIISSYFANVDYIYFIEFPKDNVSYDSAQEVLEDEMKLGNSNAGIIYENINNEFQEIAYYEKKKSSIR